MSKNIGFARKVDGKFVKQFENCFIVLSEAGEIMAWRLMTSTVFAEIEDLLLNLKQQLDKANVQLTHVYVDDCCHVREKYKSVFCPVQVSLDLFHACRRVISTTNKRLVLSFQFSNEFGLIFRDDDDQGKVRLKYTPDREKIEENLNAFINKWAYVKDGLVTQETFQATENLGVHVRKGCLSNIPPGCEQNRTSIFIGFSIVRSLLAQLPFLSS